MPLVWNWHLDEICEALERVRAGEIRKLAIHVPPGTSKSLVCSVFFPAWWWASEPGLRCLSASYADSLSVRDNLRLRAICSSLWYRHYYDFAFSGDQRTKRRFDTHAKGWRFATSVGGAGTGEHPDLIVIDDPHTAQQARSDVERSTALDWFQRTISSRGVVRDVRIVLIMQRLHEDDLAGHQHRRGGWEVITFPMRFEPDRSDPRDHRTKAGELLWPALFPEDKVKQLEYDLGPYGTASQLQQRPAPEGGGLYKREWFAKRIVQAVPRDALRCRGWDTGGTEGGGDWTVGMKLAMTLDGKIYVEDEVRGQWSAAGVDAAFRQCAEDDGDGCMIREEQEPGSSGKAVIAARAKALPHRDYGGVSVTGDKVTRGGPFRSQCEAGNVYLVDGDWIAGWLDEMCAFPAGRHDDRHDATATAYNTLALEVQRSRSLTW